MLCEPTQGSLQQKHRKLAHDDGQGLFKGALLCAVSQYIAQLRARYVKRNTVKNKASI